MARRHGGTGAVGRGRRRSVIHRHWVLACVCAPHVRCAAPWPRLRSTCAWWAWARGVLRCPWCALALSGTAQLPCPAPEHHTTQRDGRRGGAVRCTRRTACELTGWRRDGLQVQLAAAVALEPRLATAHRANARAQPFAVVGACAPPGRAWASSCRSRRRRGAQRKERGECQGRQRRARRRRHDRGDFFRGTVCARVADRYKSSALGRH